MYGLFRRASTDRPSSDRDRSREHRPHPWRLGALVATLTLTLFLPFINSVPPAAAAAAANLDQCTNGAVGPPLQLNPCLNGTLSGTSYSDWVNGNSNALKAHWKEDDFISYRTSITGLTLGSHTLVFHYETVHSSLHALDYIGSYDATETTSPTPSPGNRNNNNPCFDILGAGTGSGCTVPGTPPTPASTIAVPPANLTGEKTCAGASGLATTPTQKPGTFDLFAPSAASASLTGLTYTAENVVSGTGACSTTMSVVFNLPNTAPSGGWTVVLSWGGHIASALDWGVGNSASNITGSPYHMSLDTLDGASTGTQSRSLTAGAVAAAPTIATQISSTSIPVGGSLTDTATLTGSAGTVTGTVQFQLCSSTTTGCPQATGTNIGSPVPLANGSATSPAFGSSLTVGNYCVGVVYVNDGNSFYSDTYSGSATNECFAITPGTSQTATVVHDETSNSTVPANGSITLGDRVHDTSTVTLSNGSTPTGMVIYTFYPTIGCSGTGTAAGGGALVGGVPPNSSSEGPLMPGSYSFQATFTSSDSNFGNSTSVCEPFIVNQGSSTTATSVFDQTTNAPVPPGGSITLADIVHDTSTVTPTPAAFTPTGSVSYTFFTSIDCTTGGTAAGGGPLVGGVPPASSSEGPLAAGSYSFRASYSGDPNFTGSTSVCEPFTVGVPPTTTATVVQDETSNSTVPANGSITLGHTVHDTSTVSGQIDGIVPTGSVSYAFYTSIDCSGTATAAGGGPLVGGVPPNSSSEGPLAAGSYSFRASYSGDSNYGGSVSVCEPFIVNQGSSTTATSVFDQTTNAPVPPGGSITLGNTVHDTSTVTPTPAAFTPTGSVSYTFFTSIDCSGTATAAGGGPLVGGVPPASSSEGPLAAGSYSFRASYTGDPNFTGSTSVCEPFIVNQGSSTTATSVFDQTTNAPVPPGGSITLADIVHDTSTVTPTPAAFTPTGSVSYTFFTSIDCSGTATAAGGGPLVGGVPPASSSEGPLAAGSYSFRATYTGDPNFTGSTSVCEPFIVNQGSSTTATSVFDQTTNAPVPPGGSITLADIVHDTSTVTPTPAAFTPTGSVSYTFFTSIDCSGTGTAAGGGPLVGGVPPASSSEGPLAAGSYSFRATYSGDPNFTGSTSVCEPFIVNQGSSTTATSVFDQTTNAPVPPGGSITLADIVHDTSTVTPTPAAFTPTGSVSYTFFTSIDCTTGGTAAGGGPLVGGVPPASSSEGPLAAGSYSFRATYSGDPNFTGSTSVCEPFIVNQGSSTTATSVFDQTTNAPVPPGGSITLADIVHDTSTVTPTPAAFTPTGSVSYTFFTSIDCTTGGTAAGGGPLVGGVPPASSSEGPLAAGSYSFRATYSGDPNFTGSTSVCEPFTVGVPPTTTATVVQDETSNSTVPANGSITLGHTVHDTSTVSGQIDGIVPTGSVSYAFYTSIDCSGTATAAGGGPLVGGVPPNSSSEGPLAAGSYSFRASYSGDSNYGGSVSVCEPFTVNQGSSTTATSVFDQTTNAPVPPGGSITLGNTVHDTSTVTPTPAAFTPTGSVSYTFFTSIDCSGTATAAGGGPLVGGVPPASSSEGPLAAGSYSFRATYTGDPNFTGSTSVCEPFIVNQGSSTTATSVFDQTTNAPVPPGGSITLADIVHDTSTVTPTPAAFTPTGSVSYTFFTSIDCTTGGTPAGGGPLVGGVPPASSSEGPLAAGSYSFRATYTGDPNFTGSTSVCEPFIVNQGSSTTATSVFDQTTNAPVPPGGSITLADIVHDTSTVTPTPAAFTPTGSVSYTFFTSIDCTTGGTAAGGGPLVGGVPPASSSEGPLAAGSYSFRATYTGDPNFTGSTSVCEPFIVNQGSSTTATSVFDQTTNAPVPPGGSITLADIVHDTSTVTPTPAAFTPTGSVSYTFFTSIDCSGTATAAGGGPLVGGVPPASSSEGPLAAGSYSFRATYTGDPNFTGSTSVCEPFIVNQGSSTTATSVFDQTTNAPVPPGGSITLADIVHDTSTVTPTPAAFTPTGSVSYTFFTSIDCTTGGTAAGGGPLVGGVPPASSSEGPLAAGSYSFRATYSGDPNFTGSTSVCEPFIVNQGSSTTATSVFDQTTNAPVPPGGSITLADIVHDTSTVTPTPAAFTPTGSVSYTFFTSIDCTTGGTAAGGGPLVGGVPPASSSEGPLAAGSYSFRATYTGDPNFTGSTSVCEPFIVNQGSSTTATVVFDASTNKAWAGTETTGASAYDTSTVTPTPAAFTPTGSVSYTFFTSIDCTTGGTAAGGGPLVGGLPPASSSEGPLVAGSYSFRATYTGDSNYTESVSGCEPFTVGKRAAPISTTVFDAATNAAWAGTETTGSKAYDTATVANPGTFIPAGTVTYTFYTTVDCSGSASPAGTVTLTAAGAVPNSGMEGPLAAGDYSFQAVYSGDSNDRTSTSPCEPFTVAIGSANTTTTVFDVSTNKVMTGTETTGTSAYDTAMVTGASGVTPTGTVTYTFFTDGACTGTGSSAGTVTLTAAGTVPNSNTHGPLTAGSYSFRASYSGDGNYTGSTGACEPFSIVSPITPIAVQVTG